MKTQKNSTHINSYYKMVGKPTINKKPQFANPSRRTKKQNIQSSFAHSQSVSPEPKTARTKTANAQQIKQIAQRHYQKALKYVYKKNTYEKQMKQKQQAKYNYKQQPLTSEHTFKPKIQPNRYNQKIQEMKNKSNMLNNSRTSAQKMEMNNKNEKRNPNDKSINKNNESHSRSKDEKANKKYQQLYNWGVNHQAIRRQQMIQGQVNQIRSSLPSSLQKQSHSLKTQNRRKLSIERSFQRSLQRSLQRSVQKSIDKSLVSTKSRQTATNEIPGVKKYYLNQAKAQLYKTKYQKLMFKGNDVTGYYF